VSRITFPKVVRYYLRSADKLIQFESERIILQGSRRFYGRMPSWPLGNGLGPVFDLLIGSQKEIAMIRKLKTGEYRLYSRKFDAKTGKRRNLGTFGSRVAAQKHERDVQYFKRH
jgi:hypothetical protein